MPGSETLSLRAFLRGDDLAPELCDGGIEVRRVSVLVLAGTTLSILYHVALGVFTDARWPYTTFLFKPSVRFSDFLELYDQARALAPDGGLNIAYSGIFHLFTVALSYVPALLAWLAVVAVFIIVLVLTVRLGVTARVGTRGLRDACTIVLCGLSYPVIFVLDRANLEMVVFVLLAAFVYLYYVRDSKWSWLPLSFAIAGKYYWVVLLVLLVSDRRWRQLALTVAGTVAITLGSAVVLGAVSGAGFSGVVRSTLLTLGAHAGNGTGAYAVQHGHSLFSIPYFIDRSTDFWLQMHVDLVRVYLVLAIGLFMLVVARLVLYEVEAWRKLTALVVCAVLLPFENHDYTLIHLFLPLALVGLWGVRSRRAWVYVVCFGLLLVPLDYVQFGNWVSWSSLAYAILLIVLLVAVLTDGARSRTVPLWKATPSPNAGGTEV
jgi:hypothetical protein